MTGKTVFLNKPNDYLKTGLSNNLNDDVSKSKQLHYNVYYQIYSSVYILSLVKGNEKFQGIVNFTFRTANIPQENYAEFINQLFSLTFFV